jgi:hypothetical protein
MNNENLFFVIVINHVIRLFKILWETQNNTALIGCRDTTLLSSAALAARDRVVPS